MVGVATAIVIGAGISLYEQHEARKDQKKANKRARQIENVKFARERAQAYRQNQINAANVFNAGAASGVGGSSGVQGAISSLGSQFASNLQYAGSINQLEGQRLDATSSAQGHENNAQIAGQVASFASQFYTPGA